MQNSIKEGKLLTIIFNWIAVELAPSQYQSCLLPMHVDALCILFEYVYVALLFLFSCFFLFGRCTYAGLT